MSSYDYWYGALEGNFGPVHDSDPQFGFFRKRTGKAKGFVPVAIFQYNDKIAALVDGEDADAAEIWSYVCQHPITQEQYHRRMETGRWHDEDLAVSESLAHDPQNAPADPAITLRDQIDAALAGVKDYERVNDDETAAKAQSLRSRLLELRGDADKRREALVRPFLDGEKAVNVVYMPLVREAKAGADKIAVALGRHETAKENARKAAEAARIKAEQEAEKARLAAIEAGKPIPPTPEPPPPAPTAAPQTKIAGSYGRAASVKTVKVGTVTDQDALYTASKGAEEVKVFFADLAQKYAKAGIPMPGMTITEEKRVV